MALKILLADDSMTAQKMGQKILADAGHEVIAVSNGAAAVKKIASEKPALIVLDVYMPGYTGLEVCERVRASEETARIPVLLTLGKMETGAFKPEDATRVKADGVIIKPFEASDLLAAVKKIEEKLAAEAAAPPPDYERTQKINVAEMLKQDSSYQEWQVAAPEHKDEEEPQVGPAKTTVEVPSEMAGAAAFGDLLGEEPAEAHAAAAGAETPAAYATAPSVPIEPAPSPIPVASVPNTQKYEPPPSAHARDPELEPTSGWSKEHVEHVHDPHFEPTVSQEKVQVAHHEKDPALVTDPSEMAHAFVTKFGVENPEPIVVGVAADANIDGLYTKPEEEAGTIVDDDRPTQDVSESIAKMKEEEARVLAEAAAAIPDTPAPKEAAADDDFEKRVSAAMSSYEDFSQPAALAKGEAPAEAEAPAAGVAEPQPAAPAQAAPPEPAPAAVAEAAPAAAWTAQEAAIEQHEATMSLEQEMLKAFSDAVPPDTAPAAPEPEPVAAAAAAPAPVAAAAPANAPDLELATAMAAAVAPDAGPPTIAMAAAAAAAASGGQIDPAKLADAIHRALDKLKPELIAHIAKELDQK